MLVTCIAYDVESDLGRAYNEAMERLRDDDWAAFLDHDAMFTTRDWYKQIVQAIEVNPAAGAFTAVTNRIGTAYQLAKGIGWDNHQVAAHRLLGGRLLEKYGHTVRDITQGPPLSGVVIVISKKSWLKIGKFKSGFLGVDNRMHYDLRDAGYKIFLLPGLYVYHWYRADNDRGHLHGVRVADQGRHA